MMQEGEKNAWLHLDSLEPVAIWFNLICGSVSLRTHAIYTDLWHAVYIDISYW